MLLQISMEFFNRWEVQIGVIFSMIIQFILVLFGSKRKISNAIWLKILIWCAYMSADAVAIFSLGVLTQRRGQSLKEESLQNHQLHLLWVPFLILHLGGPDTITAYSLEDNNLWLRHMLSLVIQIQVALYAIVKSWSNHNPLTYLVIPIFLSSVVRYCERIWTLRSASMEHIGERFRGSTMQVKHTYLDEVYRFQCILIQYIADKSIFTNTEVLDQGITILHKTFLDAFRLVEDELGLVYDSLYTKALLVCSRWGIFLRSVYLISSIATLTSFVIIHVHKHKWFNYPLSDILITYFLMIGAIILEIYATIWVVLSDWMLVCLYSRRIGLARFLSPKINTFSRALFGEKRWSRRMKQWNILRFVTTIIKIDNLQTLEKMGNLQALAYYLSKLSLINQGMLMAYEGEGVEVVFDRQTEYGSKQEERDKQTYGFERCNSGEDDNVSKMKEVICKVIIDRLNIYLSRVQNNEPNGILGIYRWSSIDIPIRAAGMSKFSEFLYRSVDEVVTKYGCLESLSWSTSRTAFDETLLIWHNATTLCYYSDKREGVLVLGDNAEADRWKAGPYRNASASRYISDYLMYLACCEQKLLPAGNYEYMLTLSAEPLRQVIVKVATDCGINNFDDLGGMCALLLQWERSPSSEVSRVIQIQPLIRGIKLAAELDNLDLENKWEMVCEVWAHLLCYAAGAQTRWEEHAQHLRRGGEFITQIAALMAHASLSLLGEEPRTVDRESETAMI